MQNLFGRCIEIDAGIIRIGKKNPVRLRFYAGGDDLIKDSPGDIAHRKIQNFHPEDGIPQKGEVDRNL